MEEYQDLIEAIEKLNEDLKDLEEILGNDLEAIFPDKE